MYERLIAGPAGEPAGDIGAPAPSWRIYQVAAPAITAARFALAGAVLPPLFAALTVGDRVRMALMRSSDGHPVFTGRDSAGRAMQTAEHDHAWFLPADDDADGRIDHVLVFARGGLDAAALRALVRLRWIWGHGGPRLTATLIDIGSPAALGCLRHDMDRGRTSQLGTARIWESQTPFVPPRHIKHRASGVSDAPHEQVARLLVLHGRPPARIEPLLADHTSPRRSSYASWQQFQRWRASGHGSRGSDEALGFRLIFDRPVTGPIALGYAAHQGLGQFIAVE